MSTALDLTGLVRSAVALVCGVDPAGLGPQTTLESLGADSLARVSIADVVEADLAAAGTVVRIDDAALAKFRTLGEIDRYVAAPDLHIRREPDQSDA